MLESGVAAIFRHRARQAPDQPVRAPAEDARPALVNRFAKMPGPAVILPRRLSFLAPPRRVEPIWPGTRGQLA